MSPEISILPNPIPHIAFGATSVSDSIINTARCSILNPTWRSNPIQFEGIYLDLRWDYF